MLNLLLAALAATSVSATPVPAGHEYKAPGPDDSRSPCPGLNALANHGFLPRTGKNITVPIFITAGKAGMNMGIDFMSTIGQTGLLSSPEPDALALDLSDLDQHNFPIEHDGSLSRQDAYYGDDHSFYRPNFETVLSFYKDMTHTSIPVASQAKFARVNDSLNNNPEVVYGPREFILSYGETALYLQVMGMNTTSGRADLRYVKSLFLHERLPYEMGWSKPKQEVTLATLAAMAAKLFNNSPEQAPEGLIITEMAYKDALEGLNPITGVLGNISGY